MRRLALMLAGLILCASDGLLAQVRPATPVVRRDTLRTRSDTTRRDSTAADSTKPKDLIKWNEADSVMRQLMARPGYTATRYQGQDFQLTRAQ